MVRRGYVPGLRNIHIILHQEARSTSPAGTNQTSPGAGKSVLVRMQMLHNSQSRPSKTVYIHPCSAFSGSYVCRSPYRDAPYSRDRHRGSRLRRVTRRQFDSQEGLVDIQARVTSRYRMLFDVHRIISQSSRQAFARADASKVKRFKPKREPIHELALVSMDRL
jgi:hypothetical protein